MTTVQEELTRIARSVAAEHMQIAARELGEGYRLDRELMGGQSDWHPPVSTVLGCAWGVAKQQLALLIADGLARRVAWVEEVHVAAYRVASERLARCVEREARRIADGAVR